MNCYHCGDACSVVDIQIEDRHFCCLGCKTVYEILLENQLGDYYKLEKSPGTKTANSGQFDFLNNEKFKQKYVFFEDDETCKVEFILPQIHCSSCIWLLEHLNRLHSGIQSVQVQFTSKTATITFLKAAISISELAQLLNSIGYLPDFEPRTEQTKEKTAEDKRLLLQIGVAGFCFGNIMLLSFPEYLGMSDGFESFGKFFGWISMLLSLPVLLYAGRAYLKSAISGVKQHYINMDVPIALGMITLFVRSSFEIITQSGAGYFDSFTGLVFFLLIGKWFQQKTYKTLSFERDYTSYFPISVSVVKGDNIFSVALEELQVNDNILIRNGELIPTDSCLLSGQAVIDYSFVTGESKPVIKQKGDLIYAGGKQLGANIKMKALKPVNNSYLTKLWNQDVFQKEDVADLHQLSNTVSKYFTIVVLSITLITTLYWYVVDISELWNAATAVLIIACPCALALSVPFTQGNLIRLLGKAGIYLKNVQILERMAAVTSLVLDKTGTITHKDSIQISYHGSPFTEWELRLVKSAVSNSLHPLSVAVMNYFPEVPCEDLDYFKEEVGSGIHAKISSESVKIGSSDFVNMPTDSAEFTTVHVKVNDVYKGKFNLKQYYREGLDNCISELKNRTKIALLSGDNNEQKEQISKLGISESYFGQSPFDKLEFIKKQQENGETVAMVGDGLNDSGALKQSDVGIAISDQVHQFSPACDIILNAEKFSKLHSILGIGRKSNVIIYASFILSFAYNIVGISYAVQGLLSPVVAAVLMPLSSISIVVFTSVATRWICRDI
jgi:Cu+-exporting ATPase